MEASLERELLESIMPWLKLPLDLLKQNEERLSLHCSHGLGAVELGKLLGAVNVLNAIYDRRMVWQT